MGTSKGTIWNHRIAEPWNQRTTKNYVHWSSLIEAKGGDGRTEMGGRREMHRLYPKPIGEPNQCRLLGSVFWEQKGRKGHKGLYPDLGQRSPVPAVSNLSLIF